VILLKKKGSKLDAIIIGKFLLDKRIDKPLSFT
jgi:hypothetical protein